jgi:hypothetical protein
MRLCAADTTIYEHHRVCHHRFLRENFDDDVKTTEDTSIIKQGSDNGRIPHVSHKRLGHQIPTDHAANMVLQAHVQGREVSILMLSYRHPATGDTSDRVWTQLGQVTMEISAGERPRQENILS